MAGPAHFVKRCRNESVRQKNIRTPSLDPGQGLDHSRVSFHAVDPPALDSSAVVTIPRPHHLDDHGPGAIVGMTDSRIDDLIVVRDPGHILAHGKILHTNTGHRRHLMKTRLFHLHHQHPIPSFPLFPLLENSLSLPHLQLATQVLGLPFHLLLTWEDSPPRIGSLVVSRHHLPHT